MMRPRLLVLCVVGWWSSLAISRAMDQVVPCQEYPLDHTWATLPTVVGLRPTTTTWTLDLYIMEKGRRLLACVRLEADEEHVSVTHNSGACELNTFTTTLWPLHAFTASSFTDIYLDARRDIIQLQLLSRTEEDITFRTQEELPDDVIVSVYDPSVTVSYECPGRCKRFPTPRSQPTQIPISPTNFSTFHIYPLHDKILLKFVTTVSKCIGGQERDTVILPLSFTKGEWKKLEILGVNDTTYQVLMNGEEKTRFSVKEPWCQNITQVKMSVEGDALWTSGCDPRPPLVTTTPTVTQEPKTATDFFRTTIETTGASSLLNLTNIIIPISISLFFVIAVYFIVKHFNKNQAVTKTSLAAVSPFSNLVEESQGALVGLSSNQDHQGGNVDTYRLPPAAHRLQVMTLHGIVGDTNSKPELQSTFFNHIQPDRSLMTCPSPRPQVGPPLDPRTTHQARLLLDPGTTHQDRFSQHIYDEPDFGTCDFSMTLPVGPVTSRPGELTASPASAVTSPPCVLTASPASAVTSPPGVLTATPASPVTSPSGVLTAFPASAVTRYDSINSMYSPFEERNGDRLSQHIYEDEVDDSVQTSRLVQCSCDDSGQTSRLVQCSCDDIINGLYFPPDEIK